MADMHMDHSSGAWPSAMDPIGLGPSGYWATARLPGQTGQEMAQDFREGGLAWPCLAMVWPGCKMKLEHGQIG